MARGFSDFFNPRIHSLVFWRCENKLLNSTICSNTAPLLFHFVSNSKILTAVAARNIKSDCHVGTIVILLYVKQESSAVENRVVREVDSLQRAFLKHCVTFTQNLQKVMVVLFFGVFFPFIPK